MDGKKEEAPPEKGLQELKLVQKSRRPRRPNPRAKSCVPCRTRKIRCDTAQPCCSTCESQDRECVYRNETQRPRPTFQHIAELQRGKAAATAFIVTLKRSSSQDRDRLLASAVDDNETVQLPPLPEKDTDLVRASAGFDDHHHDNNHRAGSIEILANSSDTELDIAHFISVDEAGRPSSFGPSSALHNPVTSNAGQSPAHRHDASKASARNSLFANAALQRQLEHELARLDSIGGMPTELALHLLNLHWTRQHHTFLLTYRPAVIRDLQRSGPYCSNFLLNSIFASVSKFSSRVEVRDDPDDPATAGRRYLRRCDELLIKDSLLIRPDMCTVIGLLLLGSTYNARGETSKGWLYTGYALRMVYDLGLHLDPKETMENPEDLEIRRRVFWGAFVCDKLQSLYLGRPVAINLRDSQVSHEFLDLYEERELFVPSQSHQMPFEAMPTMPLHSVSTFQQLCLLSKIMTTIINRFYVVGATFARAQDSLQQVDIALQRWKQNISPELDFQPWPPVDDSASPCSQQQQPPNILVLHGLYYALIILLHRPFISDGHLRHAGMPERSWERCTAAARNITGIASAYKSSFTLAAAPYVVGYTIYVACTIHVRNAASQDGRQGRKHSSLLIASLRCLDELSRANPGVAKPTRIIRRLAEMNNLDLTSEETPLIEQSMQGYDMDAILNMFPAKMETEGKESVIGYGVMSNQHMVVDPLFGLMDGSAVPFDFESLLMPLDETFN